MTRRKQRGQVYNYQWLVGVCIWLRSKQDVLSRRVLNALCSGREPFVGHGDGEELESAQREIEEMVDLWVSKLEGGSGPFCKQHRVPAVSGIAGIQIELPLERCHQIDRYRQIGIAYPKCGGVFNVGLVA